MREACTQSKVGSSGTKRNRVEIIPEKKTYLKSLWNWVFPFQTVKPIPRHHRLTYAKIEPSIKVK